MFDAVICLHGFAGSPQDFEFLEVEFRQKQGPVDFLCLDLYRDAELSGSLSLEAWTQKALARFACYRRPLYVGYSMGGRLALNVIVSDPSKRSQGLILSARPGIWKSSECEQREVFESTWAERFSQEEPASVFADWDRLGVFQGSQKPDRSREHEGQKLAWTLLNWSPRCHVFTEEQLAAARTRLHWRFGEKDDKYLKVYERLNSQGFASCAAIPEAGHRLLVDAPSSVLEEFWWVWEQTKEA